MAHSDGNGIGKPVVLYAPRARRLDLEPICELPYGPAALNGRTEGRTEVSTPLRPRYPAECPCVHGGAHRREQQARVGAAVVRRRGFGDDYLQVPEARYASISRRVDRIDGRLDTAEAPAA